MSRWCLRTTCASTQTNLSMVKGRSRRIVQAHGQFKHPDEALVEEKVDPLDELGVSGRVGVQRHTGRQGRLLEPRKVQHPAPIHTCRCEETLLTSLQPGVATSPPVHNESCKQLFTDHGQLHQHQYFQIFPKAQASCCKQLQSTRSCCCGSAYSKGLTTDSVS